MSVVFWCAIGFSVAGALGLALYLRKIHQEDALDAEEGTTLPDDITSFPRCKTCPMWPGPHLPCPKTGNKEEETDGCQHHPEAVARREKMKAARERRKGFD